MVFLVADVGGTNTRLALFGAAGAIDGTIANYRNDGFGSFGALLTRYVAERGHPAVAACCIAIAGPVTSETARLTNRDWTFETATIGDILSCRQVRLINDLAALGHALPVLSGDELMPVRAADRHGRLNGQAIVVGLGTGFNVCLTKSRGANDVVVIEAEAGHSRLTTRVSEPLAAALGREAAAGFRTFEDCFSGRGLARLYRILSGDRELAAHQIIAACRAGTDAVASRTVVLTADLLGRCVLELTHLYLPFQGVFLAGGVARGLFTTTARQQFLQSVNAPEVLSEDFRKIPISVITDDAAALRGCAAYLCGAGALDVDPAPSHPETALPAAD